MKKNFIFSTTPVDFPRNFHVASYKPGIIFYKPYRAKHYSLAPGIVCWRFKIARPALIFAGPLLEFRVRLPLCADCLPMFTEIGPSPLGPHSPRVMYVYEELLSGTVLKMSSKSNTLKHWNRELIQFLTRKSLAEFSSQRRIFQQI